MLLLFCSGVVDKRAVRRPHTSFNITTDSQIAKKDSTKNRYYHLVYTGIPAITVFRQVLP